MTMLEKVSAALKAKNCEGLPPTGYYDNLARAAIEAMREPTEKMIKIADENTSDVLTPFDAREIWYEMIDAVLNEKA